MPWRPSGGFAAATLPGGGLGGGLPRPPPTLEGADQALDALVVRLERVLAEDGLALRVVELQVDPVDAVVLPLEVGPTDELPAQPGAGGLGRGVLGLLDGLVGGQPLDHVLLDEPVVEAAVRPDVVVLEVDQR